jgi:divalent metal cation (Fe/Co/Zn/Cd) transporter
MPTPPERVVRAGLRSAIRGLTVERAHAIAVDAEHRLMHAVPRLTAALVHADPYATDGTDHNAVLAHHSEPPADA